MQTEYRNTDYRENVSHRAYEILSCLIRNSTLSVLDVKFKYYTELGL